MKEQMKTTTLYFCQIIHFYSNIIIKTSMNIRAWPHSNCGSKITHVLRDNTTLNNFNLNLT